MKAYLARNNFQSNHSIDAAENLPFLYFILISTLGSCPFVSVNKRCDTGVWQKGAISDFLLKFNPLAQPQAKTANDAAKMVILC